MNRTRNPLVKAGPVKAAVSLVIVAAFVGGVVAANGTTVEAGELEVTGLITLEPDGYFAVGSGSTTYGLVGAMDFSPFVGATATVEGGVEDGTVFVRRLILGAIDVEDEQGAVTITARGTVEKVSDGFRVVVEGIAFTLVGSDELGDVVGKTADMEGELTGAEIMLTHLWTDDGEEVETYVPNPDEGVEKGSEGTELIDGQWGYQD